MAKNRNEFTLKGIADDVQYGKRGGRIKFNTLTNKFSARNEQDTSNVGILVPAIPTDNLEATSKQYVDGLISGIDSRPSAKAVAVSNVTVATLAVADVIDGYTIATDDIILLTGQTTASENGYYIVTATGAERPTDTNTNGHGVSYELTTGSVVTIENGTVYNNKQFMLVTDGTIVLDTTNLAFVSYPLPAAGSIGTIYGTFTFTAGAQTIGTAPINARIVETSIEFTTPFDNSGTTVILGDSGNTSRFMAATDNDPLIAATFEGSQDHLYAAPTGIDIVVGGVASTTGAGVVLVKYIA